MRCNRQQGGTSLNDCWFELSGMSRHPRPLPKLEMARGPDLTKRAIEIAPECTSLSDLKQSLVSEGYERVNASLSGWQLRRHLKTKLGRRISSKQ